MIDKFTEQKIKDAANIVDVISDFITLIPKGINYQCLCPFHNDNHMGSFVVHPAMNCYRCFSCDAKGGPIEFLMQYPETKLSYPDALRYLATKYGITIDDDYDKERLKNIKPAKPREQQELEDNRTVRTWPTKWIKSCSNLERDNLTKWLYSLPWDEYRRKRIDEVLKDYQIGHAFFKTENQVTHEVRLHDFTIFWMLDENNILHNGHLMKFCPEDSPRFGHRDKEDDYNQTWLHARMRYVQGEYHFDDKTDAASYCMFGQHLMTRYPDAAINIVESEKTAVFMAIAYGNNASQIWMACAGMQNLSPKRMKGLTDANRKIVLFPDRDGIMRWCKKANDLMYPNVSINTQAVKEWWKPEDGEKADIADVVERIIREANTQNK